MKNLAQKLEGTSREEVIAMLTVIDGKDFNPETYKNKRANTLLTSVVEKVGDDKKIYKLLSDKGFKAFDMKDIATAPAPKTPAVVKKTETTTETTTAPKKSENKEKNLKISEMTPEQVLKSLTPKQSEAIKRIVKHYDKNAQEVFSHRIMPDSKDAWSFGGVITTLIEKGVLTRSGKGLNKKFHVTDSYTTLLKVAKVA